MFNDSPVSTHVGHVVTPAPRNILRFIN